MMFNMNKIIPFSIIVLLMGCVTPEYSRNTPRSQIIEYVERFTPEGTRVDRFTLNRTTYAEVKSIFGDPDNTGDFANLGYFSTSWLIDYRSCFYSVQLAFDPVTKVYNNRMGTSKNCY